MNNISQNKIHNKYSEYTYKSGHQFSQTYNISVEIPGPLGEYKKTKSNPPAVEKYTSILYSYNLQGWILAKNRAKG